MDTPTIDQLVSVAGASLVTWAVLQVAIRAWSPSSATLDRFGPLLAVGVAEAVVLGATFVLGLTASADLAQALVTGLFAGLAAQGIHDTAASVGVPT